MRGLPLTVRGLLCLSVFVTLIGATPANPASKDQKIDACALLTAPDVQSIMATPVALLDKSNGFCMYGVADHPPSRLRDTHVSQSLYLRVRKQKTVEAEDKKWAEAKSILRDQPKEDVQILTGIGDEAYFVRHITTNGKIGTSFLRVRKGVLDFELELIDLSRGPGSSPDAFTAVARKVSDQLSPYAN